MSESSLGAGDDRYVISARIGSGGMADVYVAQDAVLGRRVVLKQIKPALSRDPAYVNMFFDEARVVATLSHPNIVRIYDFGMRATQPFMALEWLEGWDLGMVQARLDLLGQTLPLAVVLRLIAEAARGLHAAHAARTFDGTPLELLHRDISPQNLFVTTGGTLKILDFGVAKTAIQQEVTAVSKIKGKMSHMSPEQIAGTRLDQRTDLFSLGIVMHELLSGGRLFTNELAFVRQAVLEDPIPVPFRPDERLPDDVLVLTMRALERDPDQRFGSAAELERAVDEVMQRHGLSPSDAEVAGCIGALFVRAVPTPRSQRLTTLALGRLDATPTAERVDASAVASRGTECDADGASRRGLTSRQRQYVIAGVLSAVALATMLVMSWPAHRADSAAARPPGEPTSAATAPVTRSPASEPAPPLVAAEPVKQAGEASTRLPRETPTARRPEPVRRPRDPAPSGTLTLDTEPWTHVYLGKRDLGVTPVVEERVPGGAVVLRLVNPKRGIDREVTVDVPPGGSAKERLDLSRP